MQGKLFQTSDVRIAKKAIIQCIASKLQITTEVNFSVFNFSFPISAFRFFFFFFGILTTEALVSKHIKGVEGQSEGMW